MKKFIAILLVMFLTACATQAKYEKILNTWKGHGVEELISEWGYPKNSFKSPNGNNVYVYGSSGSFTMPLTQSTTHNLYGNTLYSRSSTYGGQTINVWCTTYFEADENNIIIKISFKGNQCKST